MDENREKLKNSIYNGACFFTGAGISCSPPSCLPLGKQITESILNLLLSKSNLLNNESINSYILSNSKTFPMELIWEVLIRVTGVAVLESLNILIGDQPNKDHIAIAMTCSENNIDTILTLNFDILQEKAINLFTGKKARSVATKEEFIDYTQKSSKINDTIWVVHLHDIIKPGNYQNLAATVSKVGIALPNYKSLPFSRILESRDVICAGYSNGDIDTFPILSETRRQLFWYLHEGPLSPAVLENKNKMDGRLIIIERKSDENSFSELLMDLFPNLGHKINETINLAEVPNCSTNNVLLLNELENNLVNYLGSTPDEIRSSSQLILAILCDELGHRDMAKTILLINHCEKETRLVNNYARNMLEGHLIERLGDVNHSIKYYSQAKKYASSDDKFQTALLEQASAKLGAWKRNPLKIFFLSDWSSIVRRLRKSKSTAICLRANWELGDFFQHIADYFLIPSSMFLFLSKGKLSKTSKPFLSILDKLSLFFLNGIRRHLFRISASHYSDALKISLWGSFDELPSYTSLALIRLTEVLAASGNLRQAKYSLNKLEKGEKFYRWILSEHGRANAICAKGIFEYYSANFKESIELLETAKKEYGSHFSGILKSEIYIFRIYYWKNFKN